MSRSTSWKDVRIYTVGHSTRSLDELVALLEAFRISILADIRTIPRSRHNPQFNGDALPEALAPHGIRYVHLPRLGGLRKARRDGTQNAAWRNASFRGFADHMQTEEFEAGLAELRSLTVQGRVALMCAEAVPWRCHRSLVADALTARGACVEHLTGSARPSPHHMTSFARIEGPRVTYPGDDTADVRLDTRAPFHLEATVRVLQRRPANRVDLWEQERYQRVLATPDGLALVAVENRGTIDEPDLRLLLLDGADSAGSRAQLAQTVRKMLGLDVDPEPLERLARGERALRPTALALRGLRPPRFAGLFETFSSVVPFQQLSLDAGVAIVGRLAERFGAPLVHESRRFYAFPTSRAVATARLDALRACGLSLRKAEALRSIARAIEAVELDEDELSRMTSSEARHALLTLPGIGPWSADLVLLRGLGRLDAFPPGDVGAERSLRALLGLRAPASLAPVADRFGDHRGLLYFWGLGGSLLARELIHPAPGRDVDRVVARSSRRTLPEKSSSRTARSPKVILSNPGDLLLAHSNPRWCPMGDKSPKSKERQKKQDAADKDQKKAAAIVKATPPPAKPVKQGK